RGELSRRPVPRSDGGRPIRGARGREGSVRSDPARALVRRCSGVVIICPVRELPQGTVTLLFTDIEGSTRLLHTLGPARYAAALLDSEPLRDLGRHRLKDFDGAVRIHQLGEREFPPLRTPGSVELPTPATPFLGREQELFDAVSLVYERDPRVLTIVGPGGTG